MKLKFNFVAVAVLAALPGLATAAPANSRGTSELLMMVQQLQDEVRSLRGQLENQQHQLSQLKAQQDSRYKDMDRRISVLTREIANQQGVGVDPNSVDAASNPTSSEPADEASNADKASDDTAGTDRPTASQAYRDAFALVRSRDFDKALSAFNDFIANYPQSAMVANAWYWKGEILLAQQKAADAKAAFTRVITDYPKANKVPDALYKLGVANGKIGDQKAAKAALDRVIKEYPDSSAAGLARNYSS